MVELTAPQRDKLASYREFWGQQAISTSPADRPSAEAAIRHLYRSANEPEPEFFLWFDSPREAAGAAHILFVEKDPERFESYLGQLTRQKRIEWERVRKLIADQTGAPDWQEAGRLLLPQSGYGPSYVRALREAWGVPWLFLGPRYHLFLEERQKGSNSTKKGRRRVRQACDEIRKQQEYTDPLRMLQEDVDEVEWICFNSSNSSIPAHVLKAQADGPGQWGYPEFRLTGTSFGQLARLDFLAKECGEAVPLGYLSLIDVARQVNLWWTAGKVAVICDRPAELLRNDEGRLHNSDGPAMVYRNGWRVYAVNGGWVDPVAVLPPDQITFDLIEKHKPFKKILVERYGKDRYREEAAERRRFKPAAILTARLPEDPKERLDSLRDSAAGQLPFYERYEAGDRIGVWNDLRALGERVRSDEHAADALAVAYSTMDRAIQNVQMLIERLHSVRFEFTRESLRRPTAESRKEWRKVERKLGALPLSLRAWWDVVGAVDFTGDHDLLSASAGLPNSALGTLMTDPLVIYPPEATLIEIEMLEGDGDIARECILAPDRYHKHGYSGGYPYVIALPCLAADGLVLYEPNSVHLVDYLRLCFRYGGFPGFQDDESRVPVREMTILTTGLLDI